MSGMWLQVRGEDGASRSRLDLAGDPITIGRHRTNALPLEDDRVSRYHCVVEQTGKTVHVRDLGSRNGTHLNEAKFRNKSMPVRPGDVIRVGHTELELMPRAAPTKRQRQSAPERGAEAAAGDAQQGDAAPVEVEEEWAAEPEPAERRSPEMGGGSGGGQQDPEAVLRRMAESLPEGRVSEADVRISNARGQPLRPPERSNKREGREGVKLLRLLLMLAARSGASDVHVEPRSQDYLVRIRVDGMMVEATALPWAVGQRLVGVVKVLTDCDIAQRAAVQEGHFSARLPGRSVDYRVSFTPVMHGQKLVVRVLDLASTPRRLPELDMPEWMGKQVRAVMRQDAGMLLCCGPTGSGKTTTLYAAIREINVSQRNVVTIEDPPEYQIDGVTQIPVDERRGHSFSTMLSSMLRQDPDVILVGEIRDAETARMALQAAMTGHLVLSTVHARDTIGAIFRLLDLGAEAHLIASALNLILAQRLARRLCDRCKVPTEPRPQQTMRMGKHGQGLSRIHYPAGCPACLQTGYRGRIGLFELLSCNEDLRDVVLSNPSHQELRKAIDTALFDSLKEAGHRLVAEGITSLDEIDRVVGHE